MKILIIGEQENFDEFKLKFGDSHEYSFTNDISSAISSASKKDFIFDFLIDEQPDNFDVYSQIDGPVIFLNTVKITLAELFYMNGEELNRCFGFNGLPSFVNRDLMEISVYKESQEVDSILKKLGTPYTVVADRVGMVTPRVVFMIINEAYYTVQEGTADKPSIDNAMKLGTNYPYGPFEWCELIGIHHIYETLESIYEDTKDERYKICPLLKREYLTVQI